MKDLISTGILAFSFLLLFAVAELLYHKLKVKAELTRKLVHFGTGIITLLFPVMLNNHWLVLLLCLSFAIILLLSIKFDLLKSINAIDRESLGSLLYPVSVYGCYLVFNYHTDNYIYFYIPILLLAICDPIAALTGKKWPIRKYSVGKNHKSLMGSTMFFISAIAVCYSIFILNDYFLPILKTSIIIAGLTCLAEAMSSRGYDNLTIPLSAIMAIELSARIL